MIELQEGATGYHEGRQTPKEKPPKEKCVNMRCSSRSLYSKRTANTSHAYAVNKVPTAPLCFHKGFYTEHSEYVASSPPSLVRRVIQYAQPGIIAGDGARGRNRFAVPVTVGWRLRYLDGDRRGFGEVRE